MAAAAALVCYSYSYSYSNSSSLFAFNSKPSISRHQFYKHNQKNTCCWPISITKPLILQHNYKNAFNFNTQSICHSTRSKSNFSDAATDKANAQNKLLQIILWVFEAVYILWLFLLPYAPGDPVWAISTDTINSLTGLSLNFFFILPFLNSVGIHVVAAPVLHPVSEGLFNFVIGWTFMFAPLLFTDCKRDRYKGSLDILWGFQMFLTNTFLIPYMAIRLNEADREESVPGKRSQLGAVMTDGAPIVGVIGGFACLISILWSLYGRMDGNFGSITERWEFLISYLGSERLAYVFVWDICFYIVFQPWLIGDNLQNIQKTKINVVYFLRFVPVIGLVAYLLCLNLDEEQ